MSNTQASETLQRPKFNPYPLFLYAIVSSIVSWLFLSHFLDLIFLSRYRLSFNPFLGYFCAQVTLFGIIAGLVGRHWLHGMALSLGLQTVICTLAFALDTVNNGNDVYDVTGKHVPSRTVFQYSVLTVVLPAIPALLMRNLKSWRLVIDPMPQKSSSIQGLLIATTFVAMITASAISSYQLNFEDSIVFGVIGLGAVAFFLPVVRVSLDGSSLRGSYQSGSTFKSRPKAEVVAYSLLLGCAGMAVLTLFGPYVGLLFGLHYAIFIVCLWIGIWCLGASGLRFRSQSMDHQEQSLSDESESESKTRTTQSFDSVQSPFSDDAFETRQNAREPVEVLGRWSLVMIAVIVAGFTLFRIWAQQR